MTDIIYEAIDGDAKITFEVAGHDNLLALRPNGDDVYLTEPEAMALRDALDKYLQFR